MVAIRTGSYKGRVSLMVSGIDIQTSFFGEVLHQSEIAQKGGYHQSGVTMDGLILPDPWHLLANVLENVQSSVASGYEDGRVSIFFVGVEVKFLDFMVENNFL